MIKMLIGLLLLMSVGFAEVGPPVRPSRPSPTDRAPVQFFDSVKGECTDACVDILKAAKSSIYIQAYSFMPGPIDQALAWAAKRGVKIEAILDSVPQGTTTPTAPARAVRHNNTMIVIILDDTTVLRGSFNFSKSAEDNNPESMLITRDPNFAAAYLEDWNEHKASRSLTSGTSAKSHVRPKP